MPAVTTVGCDGGPLGVAKPSGDHGVAPALVQARTANPYSTPFASPPIPAALALEPTVRVPAADAVPALRQRSSNHSRLALDGSPCGACHVSWTASCPLGVAVGT